MKLEPLIPFKGIEDVEDRFRIGKKLGQGMSGTVREAMFRNYDAPCAIKSISKEESQESITRWQLLESELAISQVVCHPHIGKVYEMWEEEGYYHIVMERLKHGDLYTHFEKRME